MVNEDISQRYPIYLNAFEIGLLTGILMRLPKDKKNALKNVINQLLEYGDKFRRDAGVKVTDLGDGLVKLEDKYGNVVIRRKYEWER